MTQDFSQAGTPAIGSSYTTVYLSAPTDYEDIRVALGLAPDDTTTLPDATIERRAYLPRVERDMSVVLADCEVTFGDDDDDDDAIVESVVYWTASLLAERWLARREGSQVTSQSLGPLSVSYQARQDWAAHGRTLRYQAAEVMADVCADAVAAIGGTFFAVVDDWADSEPGDDEGDV